MQKPKEAPSFQNAAEQWRIHEDKIVLPRWPLFSRMVQLARPGPDKKILDFGTGIGEPGLMAAQAEPKSQIFGVDISTKMLDVAKARTEHAKVSNFILSSIQPGVLPFEKDFFSAALCSFVLEFSNEFEKDLQELQRVLKTGGRLIVANWSKSLDKNPFQYLIPFTINKTLGERPLTHDTLFKFSDTEAFKTRVNSFGFNFISEETIQGHYPYVSIEEFWDTKKVLAPAVTQDIGLLNPTEWQAVKAEVDLYLSRFVYSESSVKIPFSSRLLVFNKI